MGPVSAVDIIVNVYLYIEGLLEDMLQFNPRVAKVTVFIMKINNTWIPYNQSSAFGTNNWNNF